MSEKAKKILKHILNNRRKLDFLTAVYLALAINLVTQIHSFKWAETTCISITLYINSVVCFILATTSSYYVHNKINDYYQEARKLLDDFFINISNNNMYRIVITMYILMYIFLIGGITLSIASSFV